MDQSMIKIAKLTFCRDPACRLLNGKHPLVRVSKIKLSTCKAIAISYTWGEFDRRSVEIGHDEQGNICTMELGEEWDASAFRNKLTRLCTKNGYSEGEEHAACWIDQLGISQGDEAEVRETLANIPSIYKRLSVVVLMPGGICKCLGDLRKAGITADNNLEKILLVGQNLCAINKVGICSYFDRVWTRQEFVYSRSIRIERTCDHEVPCVTSVDQVESLGSFGQAMFKRLVSKGHSRDQAYAFLVLQANNFLTETHNALGDAVYFSHWDPDATYKLPPHGVVDFLLGKPFHKPAPPDPLQFQKFYRKTEPSSSLPPKEQFRQFVFMRHLARLGRYPRKASRVEDYVTSVWIDCPGYVIPRDYKTRGLPSLLEDAIKQLERNHNTSLHVGCLGLFGSALWRPTRYLEHNHDVQSIDQIYDVIRGFPRRLPVTRSGNSAAIPLAIATEGFSLPLSSYAKEYPGHFQGKSLEQCNRIMAPVIHNCAEGVTQKLSSALLEQVAEYSNMGMGPDAPPIWSNISHVEATYIMVTKMLGLNIADCRSRGLKLLISLRTPLAIGLIKPSINRYRPGHLITIRVNRPATENPSFFGIHLLEGLKRPGPGGRIDVEIVGVWVPMIDPGPFLPGGWVVGRAFGEELQNSFLVDSSA